VEIRLTHYPGPGSLELPVDRVVMVPVEQQ